MLNSDPISQIERFATLLNKATITTEEFADEFLSISLEATPYVAEQCLLKSPESARPTIHGLLKRFSEYDFCYGFEALGSPTVEEQLRMQPQYRVVGEHLLRILHGTEIVEYGEFKHIYSKFQDKRNAE